MSPLALSVCLRGGQMFVIVDSHHSRLCRSYAAQAALGQPALPTFPCVTNPLRIGLGLCVLALPSGVLARLSVSLRTGLLCVPVNQVPACSVVVNDEQGQPKND
jgi:hypothetical protein